LPEERMDEEDVPIMEFCPDRLFGSNNSKTGNILRNLIIITDKDRNVLFVC
jgi:hypothetical protein